MIQLDNKKCVIVAIDSRLPREKQTIAFSNVLASYKYFIGFLETEADRDEHQVTYKYYNIELRDKWYLEYKRTDGKTLRIYISELL